MVNGPGVERGDHPLLAHVAELRDFAFFVLGNFHLRTAQHNIGLNAVFLQLFDRMLGRFGFQFSGGRNIGQQRQMYKHRPFAPEFICQLADRFQIRLPFNVADGSPDFAQDKIFVRQVGKDKAFDFVGHVRNYLNGGAEIVAAAFPVEHPLVNFAGSHAVVPGGGNAGKTFVMS